MAEHTKNPYFFGQDLVAYFNKKSGKIQIGAVDEAWEGSYSKEIEDLEVNLPEVNVYFYPNGYLSNIAHNKLKLLDRYFIPGNIVSKTNPQNEKQLGIVKKVKVFCTLHIIGTDQVIIDIDKEKLIETAKFYKGQNILYNEWLGVIMGVENEVHMKMPDGSICILNQSKALNLQDENDEKDKDSCFCFSSFYYGQKLWGDIKYFKKAKWLTLYEPTKKILKDNKKCIRGIVIDFIPISIEATWTNSISKNYKMPKHILKSKNLVNVINMDKLDFYFPILGDCFYYSLQENDIFKNSVDWNWSLIKTFNGKKPENNHFAKQMNKCEIKKAHENIIEAKVKRENIECEYGNNYQEKSPMKTHINYSYLKQYFWPGNLVIAELICTNSIIDVTWQDGKEENLPANEVYKMEDMLQKEYFPGTYVTEPNNGDFGTIEKVIHNERIAHVNWFQIINQLWVETGKEVLSVYELIEHEIYQFKIGDYVIYDTFTELNEASSKCAQITEMLPTGFIRIALANDKDVICTPQKLQRLKSHEEIDESTDESWKTDSGQDNDSVSKSLNSKSDMNLENLSIRLFEMLVSYNDFFIKFKEFLINLTEIVQGINVSKNINMEENINFLGSHFFEQSKPSIIEFIKYLKSRNCPLLSADLNFARFQNGIFPFLITLIEKSNCSNKLELHQSSQELRSIAILKSFSNEGIIFEQSLLPFSLTFSYSQFLMFICNLLKNCLQIFIINSTDRRNLNLDVASNTDKSVKQSKAILIECSQQCDNALIDEAQKYFEKYSEKKLSDKLNEPEKKGIIFIDHVFASHFYKNQAYSPSVKFLKQIKKEISLLNDALPGGIIVKTFLDRMDLFSALIVGPKGTPYEDCLFLFDIYLPSSYPLTPPLVHYVSFYNERINPNLYECGKICLSLLGTWSGEGTEIWCSETSNLFQLFVSIQGLILVSEPYYNEAGYDMQIGTRRGKDNSRDYNEFIVLRLIQYSENMITKPPEIFSSEINEHFAQCGKGFMKRLENWVNICRQTTRESIIQLDTPEFSLFPLSKGVCISLMGAINSFKLTLKIT